MTALLRRLFRHVSRARRRHFLLLFGLTLMSSAAEVVSLGAVVPFIGALTQPERVFALPIVARFAGPLGIDTPGELVLPLTLAFAAAAVVAGTLRLVVLWGSIRISNSTGADLSIEAYRRTLYQPYRVHVLRNSSEVISAITQKVSAATTVLISVSAIVTSGLLFAAILGTLLAIDTAIAGTAMLGFGIGYGILAWQTRHRLKRNSGWIAQEQTGVVKALQEGLGAIRDVLIDGTQNLYAGVYSNAVRKLQRAHGENTYINQAPRYAMEMLAMVLVAVLAYVLYRGTGNVGAALPVLGALALGAQRLLPLLQQLYGHWTVLAGSRVALVDVLTLLEQPLPPDALLPPPAALPLTESIRLDDVSFRYAADGPWVLQRIALTIPKGGRVGVVGTTGSGKSTLLDILMCLLEPTEGHVLVDGRALTADSRRAWQRTIAHVPQTIYLSDATIAENIAFGVAPAAIDMDRVRRGAVQAQIADFIESSPEGYGAVVGERGVRLSGGQRQRIGIARALYKQAAVLVFDEATSALDTETEAAVMAAIETLRRDLTILIVAHRLSTLQHCDEIVRLDHGRVTARGSYADFIASQPLSAGVASS